ncbi:Hypothetical protein NTJ_00371 [Nesidiocoris tenuis]|uniref:Uncharacterized protein n=1 Tax=Nesidiocoris tenuis TaxID=355587 RepID=A0ABN7A5S1_9HEMI|nr:Hypothetical protein NTJ_00371 [Nesidiocoris tenuis]
MRRKILEKEEKERKKRERDENGKKAYNTWLIQNKHRTLEKYYPQLGEEKIKAILLQDISKLGLTLSKDVGVGELSAGQQLSVGSNSSLNQRKQQKN